MRNLRFLLAMFAAASLATPSLAREPGASNAYPAGSSFGLPTGVNPVQGLWYENTSSAYWAQSTDSAGTAVDGAKVTAAATAPRLLWTTPWHVLGATEMAFVVIPLVHLDVSDLPGQPGVRGHTLGFANPGITPINLSWNLLGVPGLFGDLTAGFFAPLGAYSKTASANTGNNFWTIQPEAALSYISPQWLLSAHFLYDTNTRDHATGYRSGDQMFLDLTALRQFGKFQIGPVAYYTRQLTQDSNHGTFYGPDAPLFGKPGAFAPGLLVAYSLRHVTVATAFSRDVSAEPSATKGTRAYLRLQFPIR